MNNEDLDLETVDTIDTDVETPDISVSGSMKAAPKNPDMAGDIQRGQETRQAEADSMSSVLGRFDRQAIQDELKKNSSDITTFEAMTRNFNSAPRKANDGSFELPQVPDIDSILAKNTDYGRNIYDKNYKSNVAKYRGERVRYI